MPRIWSTLRDRSKRLIRDQHGPLTAELVRTPGRFGLGQVPERLAPDAATTVVCGFCSTGCGLRAHLRNGEAVSLSPDPNYPVNRGMACPKGWEALTPLAADDRARTPLARQPDGTLSPVSWDEAMQIFVNGIRQTQAKHGPDSVAFLGTGQMPTEELAFLGALAKFGLGIADGDGNTRQCMATAVEAYKGSFGFDAPPYTYADFEESDVIVLVGSNLCVAHPIMWERICRNPHAPEIVVIDPRKTETASAATRHVPLRPKSDLTLFYGLARILIENEWIDRPFIEAHTTAFEAFAQFVDAFSLARVESETGIASAQVEELASLIHAGKRVSFWWTMGVNQSHEGVRVAQSIINLALLTGNLGRPGTGANSITGQCNAMGSRLFSNTTSLFGGRSFESDADRAEVAALLGIPDSRIPARKSLAYDQILDAVREGRIRALWIVATNSAHSWIDQSSFTAHREELDFLVVQDMYATTETAGLADLVLPAAGWGEKEGTFINSERRIGRIQKVRRAPGLALSDFQIFRLIAQYAGVSNLFDRWKSPAETFGILRELSVGTPCDFSGIRDYEMLASSGGIQWPYAAETARESAHASPTRQERRLFEDGRFYHDDARAHFCFESPRAVGEEVDEHYPLVLLTGRGSSSQWHTETRTGKSAVLSSLAPDETYVDVHPDDARRFRVANGEEAELHSRRGRARVYVRISARVQVGTLFVPMHDARINQLTFASFDPYSRQPSYKHCAVSLRPLPDA